MKSRSKLLLKFFGLLPIVTILVIVSVMGENHRAKELVEDYLESVKAGSVTGKCITLSFSNSTKAKRKLSCEDQNFLFLLALMKALELKDFSSIEYVADLRKHWTPFSSKDYVSVEVSFENQGESSLSNIEFVVKREGLSWKIENIEVSDRKLLSVYEEFETLDLYKYVEVSANSLELKSARLQNDSLSYVEKMLIKYNLQRLNQYLQDN